MFKMSKDLADIAQAPEIQQKMEIKKEVIRFLHQSLSQSFCQNHLTLIYVYWKMIFQFYLKGHKILKRQSRRAQHLLLVIEIADQILIELTLTRKILEISQKIKEEFQVSVHHGPWKPHLDIIGSGNSTRKIWEWLMKIQPETHALVFQPGTQPLDPRFFQRKHKINHLERS